MGGCPMGGYPTGGHPNRRVSYRRVSCGRLSICLLYRRPLHTFFLREGLQETITWGFHPSGVSVINTDKDGHYNDWRYGGHTCKAHSPLKPKIPTTSTSQFNTQHLDFLSCRSGWNYVDCSWCCQNPVRSGRNSAREYLGPARWYSHGHLASRLASQPFIYDQAHRSSKHSYVMHKLYLLEDDIQLVHVGTGRYSTYASLAWSRNLTACVEFEPLPSSISFY